MSIFSQHSRSSSKKGFTLIELLVVMAIMVIVTTVLLVRQSRFDSSTLLRSLAYSVAVSVRQAQVYGTSVLGTSTPNGSGGFNTVYASAYGIYFHQPFGGGPLTSYTLYADLANNGAYTVGEDIKVFQLGTGYAVSKFCVTTTTVGVLCQDTAGLTTLSIFFKRPNPDAQFYTDASPDYGVLTFVSACIQLSGGDNTRTVNITSTGQISVGNATTVCQ